MSLAQLLAAVALLLCSVRGKLGVEIWETCLTTARLRLLAANRLHLFFSVLYKAVTRHMRQKALQHKHVAHNEGRMHRTSGLNPLIACVRRAEARENFHKVTVAWEPVFERALVKGYRMQASDLLALRNAACGQVPCLLHRGQVFYWARYNAMIHLIRNYPLFGLRALD